MQRDQAKDTINLSSQYTSTYTVLLEGYYQRFIGVDKSNVI